MTTGIYKNPEVFAAVVGHGDIASVLTPREGFLYFASGVSNSREKRESEYDREVTLLLKQPREAHIVYFSSLAVFYSDTQYTAHKLRMEAIVKTFSNYTIVRIGNITFGSNPHTLINYLRAHPNAEIRDEERYIIDKEEFLHHVNLIPDWNCEYNITGRRMKIKEIHEKYC